MSAFRLIVLVGAWCLLASCKPQSRTNTEGGNPKADQILANIGGEQITVAEFQSELERRSRVSPEAYASTEAREQLLNEMVRSRASLARARESGFDRKPETTALIDRLIATRFLDESFSNRFTNELEISDADVSAFYAAHSSQFQIPAAVRAGVIELKVSSKAAPDSLDEVRIGAESLRQQAGKASDEEFRRLVQKHSEDQSTRYIGGDTGWLRDGDHATRWEPAVVQAALALKEHGEVAPVLATSNGFYIVRLLERQPATVRPLRQVADSIRYQLLQAGRRERQETFAKELTNGLPIVVNREALNSIRVTVPGDRTLPPGMPGITSK